VHGLRPHGFVDYAEELIALPTDLLEGRHSLA